MFDKSFAEFLAGTAIKNDKSVLLGWIGPDFVSLLGKMPESIMTEMVGRKLSDVIQHPKLRPDARIVSAENRDFSDYFGKLIRHKSSTYIYIEPMMEAA